MSRHQRLGHIDLFDGPSWESRDYWDDVPRARSKLAVGVQVVLAIVMNLMVPAAFTAAFGALAWGFFHALGRPPLP